MKLEALTGGVLQSAFNAFSQNSRQNICAEVAFNKVAGLMVWNFIKKKKLWHRFFPVSLLFEKTYFVEHVRTDAWVIRTKIIAFTKSIYRTTPEMASFLVQLQTCGLTVFQNGLHHRCFSMKIGKFYRTMLRDCFWFLWHFQCITCLISDKSGQP